MIISPIVQPGSLVFLEGFLDWPRRSYSTDIKSVLVGDETARHQYIVGLSRLASLFMFVFLAWCFVIAYLKIKGEEAGCASGSSFKSTMVRSKSPTRAVSTDVEDDSQYTNNIGDGDDKGKRPSTEEDGDDESSIASSERNHSNLASHDGTDCYSVFSEVSPPTVREQRTQVAFTFSTVVVLSCIPLALAFSFSPLKDANKAALLEVTNAGELVKQVNYSLATIDDATRGASVILASLPKDIISICPNIDSDGDILDDYAVLDRMISLLVSNSDALINNVTKNIGGIQSTLQSMTEYLAWTIEANEEVDSKLWLMPAILLFLSSTTMMTMLGVFLSWRRESNSRLQFLLSYSFLPALIVLSCSCWIILSVASVGSSIASDVCLYGRDDSSPDELFSTLLNNSQITYKYLAAYTGGCREDVPTMDLSEMETTVQEIIDYVWQNLSDLDAIGRPNLIKLCGNTSNLESFLSNARDLAKLLISVRKALSSTRSSLSCDQVYPIYTSLVHDTVCTDTAAALSSAVILFFILGVMTMIMISLRAAWSYKVDEDRIYDEDEVAENMIVNDHEEYLEYISKYKHEWQEYDGLHDGLQATTAHDLGSNIDPEPVPDDASSIHRNNDEVYTINSLVTEDSMDFESQSSSQVVANSCNPLPSPSSSSSETISFESLNNPYVPSHSSTGWQMETNAALPSLFPTMNLIDTDDEIPTQSSYLSTALTSTNYSPFDIDHHYLGNELTETPHNSNMVSDQEAEDCNTLPTSAQTIINSSLLQYTAQHVDHPLLEDGPIAEVSSNNLGARTNCNSSASQERVIMSKLDEMNHILSTHSPSVLYKTYSGFWNV
jgi:hypothetical protein